MEAEQEFLNIRRYLANWVTEVLLANASGYYDINKLSEGTALILLNLVLELNLQDLNKVKSNFPGIDLGDYQKGQLAFQVSSQINSAKIISSLETFRANNYVQTFPRGIHFLIINNRKNKYYSKKFEQFGDIFDPRTHIYFPDDLFELIKEIYYKDKLRFIKIRSFLEQEFGPNLKESELVKPLIEFESAADKFSFYKQILSGRQTAIGKCFIPLPCMIDDEEITTDILRDRIFTQTGTIILGPSGSGKSIYAKLIAQQFLANGISIILEAKYYEASLEATIDKEAKAIGFISASDLFRSALELNLTVLLVIDGYNECAPQIKDRIPVELEKLQSTYSTKVLITSQFIEPGFDSLNLLNVKFNNPPPETKKAIASQYSGRPVNAKLDSVLKLVTSCLEAKMAGEIATEEVDKLSCFTLFEVFIGLKLSDARNDGFLLLAHLARLLSEKIAFSLPQRKLDEILRTENIPETVFRSCLDAKILEQSLGKISFVHELFLNFFVAESVVRFAESELSIISETKAPRNYDRVLLILGSIGDVKTLNAVLVSLTDVELLNTLMHGEGGEYCKKWIEREVIEILGKIEQEISQLEYEVDEKAMSHVKFIEGSLLNWTDQEKAIIALVPFLLVKGEFLSAFFELIQKMDKKASEAVRSLWEECRQKNVGARSAVFSTTYVGLSNYRAAITTIFSNLHSGFVTFKNQLSVTDEMIQNLLQQPPLTAGQFYFLLTLLRWDDKVQHLYAYALNLLKNSWRNTPYHLRTEILDKASHMYKTESQRVELIDAVNAIHSVTQDPWESTNLFDALNSLGALEDDANDYIPVVVNELNGILSDPNNELNCGEAQGLYNRQFDHPYEYAYQTVLANLEPAKKLVFFEMALKGLKSPFLASHLLIESADVLNDGVCPLIIKWTAKPLLETSFPQDSLRLFLLSHLILAKHQYAIISRFAQSESKTDRSLLAVAEIYYWFNRLDLDEAQAKTLAKNAAAALFDSDNIYLIDTFRECRNNIVQSSVMRLFEESSIRFIDDLFQDELLSVARKTLGGSTCQQKIMPHSFGYDVTEEAINLLLRYGSLVDIDLLHRFTEHPEYGKSAVKCIQKLTLK